MRTLTIWIRAWATSGSAAVGVSRVTSCSLVAKRASGIVKRSGTDVAGWAFTGKPSARSPARLSRNERTPPVFGLLV